MPILNERGRACGGQGATLLFTQVTPMQGHPRYQPIHVGIKVERGLEFRFLIWERARLPGRGSAPQLPPSLLLQQDAPGPQEKKRLIMQRLINMATKEKIKVLEAQVETQPDSISCLS